MKRYAILLGTEEYKESNTFQETRYCHSDVNLLKETLVKYCDFADQDVYVELLSIYEERKPKDILEKITEFIKESKEGDTVLFYYAGHGIYINGESYIILPDTKKDQIEQTAISLRDISKVLKNNNRINVRIFDSCHSGQDVRGMNNNKFTEDIMSNNLDGWVTLASCSVNENSYVDDILKHGVFTYFLCESIKEYNEDENILPEIIKVSTCEKVSKWCQENDKHQTPTLNASLSGNIAIAKRKKNEKLKIKDNKVVKKNEDLISRINNIRGNNKIDLKHNNADLSRCLSIISKKLDNEKNNINVYGSEIEINEPSTCKEIDSSNIKKTIVKYFNSNNYKTIYDYKIDRKYENPRKNNFFSYGIFYDNKPKLKSIEYIIEEPWDAPNNYIDFDINSDIYLPSAKAFLHVSPLQLIVCILPGIEIDENVYLLDPLFIKLTDDNKSIDENIEGLIEKLINEFNDKYKKEVLNCLETYENELRLVR